MYLFIIRANRKYAPVAQLDRALGYGPGGSGFKSSRRTIYEKYSPLYFSHIASHGDYTI